MLQNAFWILGAMLVWGAIHSLTASLTAKAISRKLLGARLADGWYRLAYNIFAGVSFLPVMAVPALLPDTPLYTLPGWALLITVPVQLLAGLWLVIATLQVDLPAFIGVRQAYRWLMGEPFTGENPVFVARGIYAWVRHPLYFLSLVFLWLLPVMTVNALLFNLAITAYFWIGSVFEEQKLIVQFGDVYRDHMRRVPRFIPWPPAWQRPARLLPPDAAPGD